MNEQDVETYIHDEIEDVEAIPQAFTERSWNADAATPPECFGWTWPELTDEGYVVKFCPAVIHKTMQEALPEESHMDYLRVVVATLHLHIALTDDYPDPSERAMAVDTYLHERASGSVDLLSEVQLAVLDDRT